MELKKKIKLLPKPIQAAIKQTIKNLRIASTLPDRAKRLRAITDEEWRAEVEKDEAGL